MLYNYTTPEFHPKILVKNKQAGIVGQKADSIPSCSYFAIANRLIKTSNPQDGVDKNIPQFPK